MNVIRGHRSPLAVAAAAAALAVAIGALLWVRLHPAAVTFVTDGARPDEWLAVHPTGASEYTPSQVAALTISRDRSVTLRCAVNSLGLGEIVLGTDGISLFMQMKGTDSGAPPLMSGVVTLDSLGERFEHGARFCYAVTWPPVAPNTPPSDSVAIRFALEGVTGELADALAALDEQLVRHQIAPPDHTRGVDAAITAHWPDLGWRPRWEAP